jgi:hypothetical protein
LRQRQALGGTAHVAFFVDRDEIPQLFEIHKYRLSKKLLNRNGAAGSSGLVYRDYRGWRHIKAPNNDNDTPLPFSIYIGLSK